MPWYKNHWPIIAMFVAMIGSWTPYFVFDQTPKSEALIGYGAVGSPWPTTAPAVFAVVDGRVIFSYKKTHHVAGIAFHLSGGDPDDVSELQKSALYDIRNEDFEIIIPVDADFSTAYRNGARMTNYRALLIPNGVRMEDFKTVHEAKKLGVIVIGFGGGPP